MNSWPILVEEKGGEEERTKEKALLSPWKRGTSLRRDNNYSQPVCLNVR